MFWASEPSQLKKEATSRRQCQQYFCRKTEGAVKDLWVSGQTITQSITETSQYWAVSNNANHKAASQCWCRQADGTLPQWTQTVCVCRGCRSHGLFQRTQMATDDQPLLSACGSVTNDIPAQFNLSHLLRKDHTDSQCPTAPVFGQRMSHTWPPVLPLLQTHFLALPCWDTPKAPRGVCPRLLHPSHPGGVFDAMGLPLGPGCYVLTTWMTGYQGWAVLIFVVSMNHVEVFLWLVQVYRSMLFFG